MSMCGLKKNPYFSENLKIQCFSTHRASHINFFLMLNLRNSLSVPEILIWMENFPPDFIQQAL